MNKKFSNIESFRKFVLFFVPFLIIGTITWIIYLHNINTNIFSGNVPFSIYIVAFLVPTVIPIVINCVFTNGVKGCTKYFAHFFIIFLTFIFLFISLGNSISWSEPIFSPDSIRIYFEGDSGIPFLMAMNMLVSYISSYLCCKLSGTMKNFLFNNFDEYTYENGNYNYADKILYAYSRIKNCQREQRCLIDDCFSGFYHNKKFDIVECQLQHTVGYGNSRNCIVDFNGILLAIKIKNTDKKIIITKDNYKEYSLELEKFFQPDNLAKKITKFVHNSLFDTILIDNDMLYYFKAKMNNSFEPSIFCSLEKNWLKLRSMFREIEEMLSISDILKEKEII